MKKTPVLFFVLFILSVKSSFAQKIHISDSSNKWKFIQIVSNPYPMPPAPSWWWVHATISRLKDTFIYNYKYTVFNDISINGVTTPDLSGRIILRDDTITNKVLYRDMNNDSDIVLYDYNLALGDTFKITNPYLSYPNPNTEHQHKVVHIDTIQINGIQYHVWYFDEVTPNVFGMDAMCFNVIEGVGSTKALTFPLIGAGCGSNYSRKLECFNNNNSYPNIGNSKICNAWPCSGDTSRINIDSCNWAAGISTPNIIADEFVKLYPNPTTGIVNVKLKDGVKRILLQDLCGRTIYSRVFYNNASADMLDITSLEKGIYVLCVYDFYGKLLENKKVVRY